MFHAFMIYQRFQRNAKDYGLYTKIVGGENRVAKDVVFVTIYVDDLLLIGDERWLNSIETALMNEFKMTKMGSLRYLLGIEVDLVPGKALAFRQRRYLDKVIDQFGSQDMHPVDIPMAVSWEPKELDNHDEPIGNPNGATSDESSTTDDEHPYRSLVGALQYLVRGTRPDIAFAVRKLAKYSNSHTKEHWMLAKRVLKYLVGTKDYGLAYDIAEARGYDKPTIED
jgi:hypothetical protein